MVSNRHFGGCFFHGSNERKILVCNFAKPVKTESSSAGEQLARDKWVTDKMSINGLCAAQPIEILEVNYASKNSSMNFILRFLDKPL